MLFRGLWHILLTGHNAVLATLLLITLKLYYAAGYCIQSTTCLMESSEFSAMNIVTISIDIDI
jgi:hypothetical protein